MDSTNTLPEIEVSEMMWITLIEPKMKLIGQQNFDEKSQ